MVAWGCQGVVMARGSTKLAWEMERMSTREMARGVLGMPKRSDKGGMGVD